MSRNSHPLDEFIFAGHKTDVVVPFVSMWKSYQIKVKLLNLFWPFHDLLIWICSMRTALKKTTFIYDMRVRTVV